MADMLERVAKLLNQAENASTEAEAAAFMAMAQKLSTANSIDLAHARHATIAKERTVPEQRTIHIGTAGTRGLGTLTDLYLGIASANDITCTIAHNNTRVYAVGFAEDLDVSEAMFASLQVQQAKAADDFKREGSWQQDTTYREGRYKKSSTGWYDEWIDGGYVPVTWLTARLNFQDAYASRIRMRLSNAKWDEEARVRKAEEERAARPHLDDEGNPAPQFALWLEQNHGITVDDLDDEDSFGVEFCEVLRDTEDAWTQELVAEWQAALSEQDALRDSTALVLVEKREAVAEAAAPALKRARGTYRGGHSGGTSSSGRAAGRAAADRARLGGSTAIGGVKGSISA